MQYVLVPRYRSARQDDKSSRGGAQLWVAAFADSPTDDPNLQRATLETSADSIEVRDWRAVPSVERVWFASHDLPDATTSTEFRLVVDSVERGSCVVAPLPQRLGAEPFRVVLASCFDPGTSRSTQLKELANELKPMPALKIFCGDQVYLDPTFPASLRSSSLPTHGARATSIYRQTWTHPGFQGLLARGMNVFCPDDHDFWDNYTVEAGTLEPERAKAAAELLAAFQCGQAVQELSVSPLRFMVVDTRQQRTKPSAGPDAQFVDPEVFERMIQWIGRDDGPGVLVLGQPIFGEEGYRAGRFGSDIPQYTAQFGRLAEALANAPRSVLILSGDVHWGRVAKGTNRKSKALVEVISSPLAMSALRSVAALWRPWREARRQIGSVDCKIETCRSYKPTTPHFTTLDFTATGAPESAVDVKVQAWPIKESSRRRREGLACSFQLT